MPHHDKPTIGDHLVSVVVAVVRGSIWAIGLPGRFKNFVLSLHDDLLRKYFLHVILSFIFFGGFIVGVITTCAIAVYYSPPSKLHDRKIKEVMRSRIAPAFNKLSRISFDQAYDQNTAIAAAAAVQDSTKELENIRVGDDRVSDSFQRTMGRLRRALAKYQDSIKKKNQEWAEIWYYQAYNTCTSCHCSNLPR